METSYKGLKVLEVFTDFEKCFGRLSVLDQEILVPDKVAMFLCAVDMKDMCILMEEKSVRTGRTNKAGYRRKS